jgi:hypothetical protein
VARVAPPGPATQPRHSGTDDVKRTDGIDLREFSCPVTVEELHRTRCAELPIACGVYVVLHLRTPGPVFLPTSSAGWFKGKDPSYPADVVKAKWVPCATVVYVGKTVSKKGLRGRVRALVDFAFGKPVGRRPSGRKDALAPDALGAASGSVGTRVFSMLVAHGLLGTSVF